MSDQWLTVAGTVTRGHGVASGRGPNSPYPISSLHLQKPFFTAHGLDLSPYFEGTLNLSIAPHTFKLIKPQFTFPLVAWTTLHPPETFSFSACRVIYRDATHDGWVYYPHPETKIRHFQDSTIIEVIAAFIPDLDYGDRVTLELNPIEISLDPI
ncbi:MAG: hypothetical protein U0559_12540 [Anaerolineae bacterium]